MARKTVTRRKRPAATRRKVSARTGRARTTRRPTRTRTSKPSVLKIVVESSNSNRFPDGIGPDGAPLTIQPKSSGPRKARF